MPPIFCNCCSCDFRSLKSKPLPLATFFASFSASSTSTALRTSSTSATTSPMPRMRRAMPIRIERLERLALFAGADEQQRATGDLAHRQRGAAARVAISLGEDGASQCERFAESLRRMDCILAGHGIDHEESFLRLYGGIDVAHFLHQRGIDVQAAGGYRRSARRRRRAARLRARSLQLPAERDPLRRDGNPRQPARPAPATAAQRRDDGCRC